MSKIINITNSDIDNIICPICGIFCTGHTGSSKCIECHKKEYKKWLGSDHDNAMDVANDSSVVGDFNNGKMHGQWLTYHRNGIIKVKSIYIDDEIVESTRFYNNGCYYRFATRRSCEPRCSCLLNSQILLYCRLYLTWLYSKSPYLHLVIIASEIMENAMLIL